MCQGIENKPHVYALSYKGIISYIGIHNGTNPYYFTGGVIPRRMEKHKFIKGVLEYCNLEDLTCLEILYIEKYKPKFNLTSGGESTQGTKHSKETIEKRKISFRSNIENMKKITENMLKRNSLNNPCIKYKVFCLTNNTEYESIRKAGKELNIDSSHLSKHLKGLYPNVKGYIFKLIK